MKRKVYFIVILTNWVSLSLFCQASNHDIVNTKLVELVETKYIGFYSSEIYESKKVEKFDTLGRLMSRSSTNSDFAEKSETLHFYTKEFDRPEKTIEIGRFNSFRGLPDSIVIWKTYNSKRNLSSNVVTTTNDSLLWIESFEYNENNDVVFRTYHEVPKWIHELMPEYIKDSTYYDYELNIFKTFAIGPGGIITMTSGDIVPKDNCWIYDKHGNLLENEFIINEYVYDNQNNWVCLRSYKKEPEENKLKYTKERTIKYRKNASSNSE